MGISTHILDTALGRPAANVPINLALLKDSGWILLNDTVTDPDGRCKHLLPESQSLHPGTYRIRFYPAAYYQQNHLTGLYPVIEITFTVANPEEHYHIPLLLTANGYTTYRGS
jgi:5-hydroxyisourate hydrolase